MTAPERSPARTRTFSWQDPLVSARALRLGAGEVRCEGTVLSLDGQVATAEGRVLGALRAARRRAA